MLIEKCLRGDHHPGRAESTLDGPFFDKTFLKRVKFFSLTETLDGGDLLALNICRQCETRKIGLSIEKNGASPAHPLSQPFLVPVRPRISLNRS